MWTRQQQCRKTCGIKPWFFFAMLHNWCWLGGASGRLNKNNSVAMVCHNMKFMVNKKNISYYIFFLLGFFFTRFFVILLILVFTTNAAANMHTHGIVYNSKILFMQRHEIEWKSTEWNVLCSWKVFNSTRYEKKNSTTLLTGLHEVFQKSERQTFEPSWAGIHGKETWHDHWTGETFKSSHKMTKTSDIFIHCSVFIV